MVLKKRFIALVSMTMALVILFFCATNVEAARMDMVDVSNNNGEMTISNFQDMHNNYGVKAMVTKISEGASYKDADAAIAIKNAQSAGLYVNGYHYARYNSVAGATAEADFAAKMAQEDGLPSGAVLAVDVESSEQSHLSESQNDADNSAFMTEVAKYGYRSTIYTMGSWVGTVMNVDQGWIASYPYNATDLTEYSTHHGWQWSDTYTFNRSYGYFDVSQLYDNYFTSYQTPDLPPKGVITVNNNSGVYVPLMALQSDGSMSPVTNRGLSNNTPWATDQTRVVNGITYYRVATNEWVASQYVIG